MKHRRRSAPNRDCLRGYFGVPVAPVFGVVPDCVPVEPVAPGAPPLWFIKPVSFSCMVRPAAGCSPWALVFPLAGVCGCCWGVVLGGLWVLCCAKTEVAKTTAPAITSGLRDMPSSSVELHLRQRASCASVPSAQRSLVAPG